MPLSDQSAGMNTDDRKPPVSLFRLFWRMGGWAVLISGALLLVLGALVARARKQA